eukprot:COSAG06_NODE_19729_length_825_cov_0.684573_1_plen_237_part_10
MVLSGCGPPRALAAARALLWPACDEHHALLLPRDIEASGNSSSPRVLIRCIMDVHNGGGNQLPEPEPEPTTATQHSGCSDDQRQQAGGVVAASPWPLLPEGVPPAHTAWPTAPGQPPLATVGAAAANGEPTVFNLLMELCETDLWTCLEAGPPTATAAMYCGRGDGGAPAPSSGATCSIGWRECAQWSRSLVEALQYLHSQSVVHRDLNPWNVFVTVERQLKLGDFGMAVRPPVPPD